MPDTIASLTKKSKRIVSARIRTAAQAAKPATTKTAKKAQTSAKKELRSLVAEQRVVAGKLGRVRSFEAKATASATPADKQRKAKAPGKRVSKAGKVYYESRTNRADSAGKRI